jgi:uncharacterized protein
VSETLQSAIYEGTIRHRRGFPFAHSFRYPIYLSYLDLDELEQAFGVHPLYSHQRRNVAEFRRADFFGDCTKDLKTEVLDRIMLDTGMRPDGPVRLLTHLRHFGSSFNPVSFYYCFARDGSTLLAILAEITNTPWGERHAYSLPVQQAKAHGSALHWQFAKQFHVSPFLPMQMGYDWRFQTPGEALRVHMDCYRSDQPCCPKQFDATLVLRRLAWNRANLSRALLRFPFITLGVMWKIYWNALRLKWKRNPFFDHPKLHNPPS